MKSPIVVVSTAANCPEAARRCCASVAREGARHLYVATDYETVYAAVAGGSFTTEIELSRRGQIENLIALIAPLSPETIVIHLDGDDELTPGAVERVAREYENPDVWLTYGSFVRSDGLRDRDWDRAFGTRYSPAPGSARSTAWRASHLRTFRAGLFQSIPKAHYTNPITGQPFTHCVDRALMLPMIEMAGERYSVIQDVLCVYNYDHDRSVSAAERDIEAHDRKAIHAMRPLAPLAVRPW